MNILFDGFFKNGPEDPTGEPIRRRIKAKVDFWTFMDESAGELIVTFLEPEELAKEIVNTAIWMLHPHYEGPEIMEEAKLILKSLNIQVPEHYDGIFYMAFRGIVSKKMIGTLNRKSKPDGGS